VFTRHTTDHSANIARIELQYLPCLEYFACILSHDLVWIDIAERYQKQTYRNRCDVLTSNKVDTLSIPVRSYEKDAQTVTIEIDYSQDWIRRHLGCLKSAYGKSPFFEFYFHEFESVYKKKLALLSELNCELLTICLKLLGIKTPVTYKLSGCLGGESTVVEVMSLINNRKELSEGLYYRPVEYYQTFGNDFVSNLSIVDLLFNTGPEARGILKRSMNNFEAGEQRLISQRLQD
jgi:hypothetical protein